MRMRNPCVMEVGVARAAALLGVSPQRIRALIQRGDIRARREGAVWLIDPGALWTVQRVSRPLSPPIASALLEALSGQAPRNLTGRQQDRLHGYLARLHESKEPGPLLTSWLAARPDARPIRRSIHSSDLLDFRDDPRVTLSGVSDPRSRLATLDVVEGYVQTGEWPSLAAEYMATASGEGNVLIRLVADPLPGQPPLGRMLADLALWPGPREQAAVRRLIRDRPS